MGGTVGKTFLYPKTQRLTDRGLTHAQIPHACFFSERSGQPCPELGSAQHVTFPAAPCRPCPLAAWPPPCRSALPRSPPAPGQLPRIGITNSGMGPKPLMRPRARVACTEKGVLGTQNHPKHTTFPFLLNRYLEQHPQRARAWPEWPGLLLGPGAASSLQQDPKPSKCAKPTVHLAEESPTIPLIPGPSLAPSCPSPTSMGPAYGWSPDLLVERVHNVPLWLASVTQPLKDLSL